MRKITYLAILFVLLPLLCGAQAYRHISVENGLSNRKVYAIQKDRIGYMWFLTHKGIDRYDGKNIKNYTLRVDGDEINSLQDLNWLYTDSRGNLWEISKRGRVFRYDGVHDDFRLVYQTPAQPNANNLTPITFSFIDRKDHVWLCANNVVYIYDPVQDTYRVCQLEMPGNITYISQYADNHFFVGTDLGMHEVKQEADSLFIVPNEELERAEINVNYLYYDVHCGRLLIGTLMKGLYEYKPATGKMENNPRSYFADITITRIISINQNELLVATDGVGMYKLNTATYGIEPYPATDRNSVNNPIGSKIADIYIDSVGRVWMADYPFGITVIDERYSHHKVYTHAVGNKQSLINNSVNCVIEDSDQDLWFATNNGVSYYNSKTNRWHSFLSSFDGALKEKNHIFLSICESEPGIFYVGGYSSNIYRINKRTLSVEALPYGTYRTDGVKMADRFIRSIIKGTRGGIWMGGYYNLKRLDPVTKNVTVCSDFENITVLLEKDKNHLWVGSSAGLYLFNKETSESSKITLPSSSDYIYSLCQTPDDKLYIGTNGSGLVVYDFANETFEHFHPRNSALISSNVYAILAADKDNIIFSSESGLTRLFYPTRADFHNWTKEQGLSTDQFNAGSCVMRSNGNYIFGSSEGAIELDSNIELPLRQPGKMVFSEFNMFYEPVHLSDPGSPLKTIIDETQTLTLKHNQNIFSIRVSSIDYDYPSDVLYSWRLAGFYDNWSVPGTDNLIRFTNLNSGTYTLQVRTLTKEIGAVTEERSMKIVVKRPYWSSFWAMLIYLALLIAAAIFIFRYLFLRKERRASEEKFQFFINTAHDIRTPLTLVKAPLEEMQNSEQFTPEGQRNMNTALRNVNVLLRLTNNLINFEHTDIYSSELYIAEHEVHTMMKEIVNSFKAYAATKQINFTFERKFKYLNVWFDREKMDSIIRNIISNALKYTPMGGSVRVLMSESAGHWSFEVRDSGIGIPESEQRKIFRDHFRGSNAVNSKVSGSGIGMVLVARLVKLHRGKIVLRSAENQGTDIKVSFPKGYNHFKRAHLAAPFQKVKPVEEYNMLPVAEQTVTKTNTSGRKILVVEDNDELRAYLAQTLSDEYQVQTSENGKEALLIVKEYMPELIISDIMMPEMRGDELCAILKKDIDTSHIPIILLTALNDERSILKGIQTGADEYIVKPFNIGILKATVANLLANRVLLRNKFARLELEQDDDDDEACTNCTTDLDWKFMANLRVVVEENIDDSEFTVDTLSAAMNMSRTSLYNKIKALTDGSPSDFIRMVRLKKAGDLLLEGTYTVTEVADLTGFNDAKYFREVFKKHFGVSPSKYKDKK